jgi:hypothetical protein
MILTCRPVSQQHWLAHGSGHARAHRGWTIRVLARRTAAGYRRERRGQCAADVSLVSGGSGWSGRAPISRPGSTFDRISVQTELADDGGRGNNPAGMRSPRVAVSLNDSWRQAPGRRTRPLATDQPSPRPRTSSNKLFRRGSHNARNRSRVEHELALRPRFSPQARMPPTALPAPRGARRGLLVLTAGPAPYLTGVTPPARWTRPSPIERAGVLAGHASPGTTSRYVHYDVDELGAEHCRIDRLRGDPLTRYQAERVRWGPSGGSRCSACRACSTVPGRTGP